MHEPPAIITSDCACCMKGEKKKERVVSMYMYYVDVCEYVYVYIYVNVHARVYDCVHVKVHVYVHV
jgi:hypothetical protein